MTYSRTYNEIWEYSSDQTAVAVIGGIAHIVRIAVVYTYTAFAVVVGAVAVDVLVAEVFWETVADAAAMTFCFICYLKGCEDVKHEKKSEYSFFLVQMSIMEN